MIDLFPSNINKIFLLESNKVSSLYYYSAYIDYQYVLLVNNKGKIKIKNRIILRRISMFTSIQIVRLSNVY